MNKAIAVQIETRINRIKGNIHNMENARSVIIEDLIYLSEHKKELKAVTGKTYNEQLQEFTTLSRRYINQLISNYQYLKKYRRLELFDIVDTKKIEYIRKVNKPELLNSHEEVTRPKTGDGLLIRDADIIEVAPSLSSVKAQIKQYLKAHPKAARELIDFIKSL